MPPMQPQTVVNNRGPQPLIPPDVIVNDSTMNDDEVSAPPPTGPVEFKFTTPILSSKGGPGARLEKITLQTPKASSFMQHGALTREVTRTINDIVTKKTSIESYTEIRYETMLKFAAEMSGVPVLELQNMQAVDMERLGATILRMCYNIPQP